MDSLRASQFILALALLWLVPIPANAQIYLLSQPITRMVKQPKPVVAALTAADLLWSASSTYLLYHATGEPFSAALLFGVDAMSGISSVNAYVHTANLALAHHKNRKTLREIAAIDGVRELRVLNTGFAEQTGVYSSRLNSSSFVFVEMPDGKAPAPYQGEEWIPVSDEAKFRFQLEIPGFGPHPRTLELGMKDVFEGGEAGTEVLKEWREGVKEWRSQLSLYERHISKKGLENLKVTSSLVLGGEAVTLGEVSHGKGVNKILGLTKLAALRSLLTGKEPELGTRWKTKNSVIIKSKGCRTWFSRLLGRQIYAP